MATAPTPPRSYKITSSLSAADNARKTTMNNSTSSKAGNNLDEKSNQLPVSSTSQRDPKSVVPQLMDIYDDLKQSSTPQTTTLQLPQNPMPKGVYYSGSHKSFNSLSHTNQRNVGRKSSGSQFNSGGVVPATTTSGTAKSRKSAPYQVMANETEEYNSKQQASRKKGKTSDTDQRWSKRFSWPDEIRPIVLIRFSSTEILYPPFLM